MNQQPITLFEFDSHQEAQSFSAIDDRVMGGVSNSKLIPAEESTAMFCGTVSLENNGGFASVRALLSTPDLTAASAFRLRVKGDGKSYKLRLFNSATFDSVAYEQSFKPAAGIWEEVTLPFDSLIATWRGNTLKNPRNFNKNAICSIGLMIAAKQVGDFQLLIDWIRAC